MLDSQVGGVLKDPLHQPRPVPLAPIDPVRRVGGGIFASHRCLLFSRQSGLDLTTITHREVRKVENLTDLEKTLQAVEPILPKFQKLCEKEFSSEEVRSELEKLSKEEMVELQVNMFSQYHHMARLIVDMAEALKAILKSSPG